MPVTNKGFGELFSEGKNSLDHLQKSLANALPSFPGMPAAKYFDLAIGIDFHPTIAPPCPVFPVPHIGMVFDIFGAIFSAIASVLPAPPPPPAGEEAPTTVLSVANAVVNALKPSVKVHGQWVANAGTGILHLPAMVLHLAPLVAPMSSSEMWMGSSTVLADGGPFSTQFHPALSCNIVGFPSLFRKNKPPKPKMALMAPTSMLLIITSGGAPVLVGGPPTIDLFQLAFKMGLKGLGKGWKKLKNADAPPAKTAKLADVQPNTKCKGVGEPVDVASGRVYHTNADFELPGPIPLVWQRTYYSDVEVNGPLGYNWHHSYNMGLYNMDNGYFTVRLNDGRETVMPALYNGEIFYNRKEQLFFCKDEQGYFVTDASKLVYRFNGEKNSEGYLMLSSITNPQGFTQLFNYDNGGRLTQIIDSSNRTLQVESDALDRLQKIYTYANGREITLIEYSYDAGGNMVQTQDASGATKHFYYDEHLLVKLTNQSNTSFYWEYEGRGDNSRCIHTWGDGGVLEYWLQYEEGHTIARNSLGHTTEYFYDDKKLINKIVDANGGITRQTYNSFQELGVVVNPEGGAVQYHYNQFGKLIRLVNENEESTSYSYDENLNLTGVTSPGGMSISWQYDDKNRIIKRTGAAGNTINYKYNGLHLTQITDHKNRSLLLQYDEQHNLVRLQYPNQLHQSWHYDDLGNLTHTTDVRGNTTSYRYDDASQVIWLKEPDGNTHQFEYDTAGNLIQAEDATHNVEFDYGPLGALRGRTQNGRSVRFNYDTELQLRSIANEGGELYKFGLDALGQVVSEWGFDGMNRRYLRDGNGRVEKVLRPAEKWTSYDYDSVGNIVKEEHSDGNLTAYRYSKDGLLNEAFNEASHIQLKRDKAGRVVKEIQGSYEVAKQYDSDGNCISTTSNLGAAIQNSFDEQGLLKNIEAGITLNGEAKGTAWQAALIRDNSGLELHRQLTGGVAVQLERDELGRVTRRSIGAGNIEQSRNKYEWGKGNKLRKIVNELTRANTSFEYDAFDNLISAQYKETSGTETIYRCPDAIGNLFKTKERGDRKYGKGGQLLQDDNYNYYYDAEGNLVFKEFRSNANGNAIDKFQYSRERNIAFKGSFTGWSYEWAGNGMLQKVITPAGKEVAFTYDPLGRRIAKAVSSPLEKEELPAAITRWVWDGNVPLHEWNYRGEFPPQSIVSEDGEIIETKEPTGNVTTWVYEDGSFVPCAKIDGEKKYSIVSDYLGTPTHAYNEKGSIVWERELDCYGAVRKEKGVKGLVPQLYQGQYMDEETGLAYNRFRYYDRESGGYLSQDPIGLAGGRQLYGYVNDTNAWIDLFGLNELQDIANEAHSQLDKFAQKKRVTAIGRDGKGNLYVSSSTPTVDKKIVDWADKKSIAVVHSGLDDVHAEEALVKSNRGIVEVEPNAKVCIDCEKLMKKEKIKFETGTTGRPSKNRQAGGKFAGKHSH